MAEPTWKHADIFPIIERIIVELCEETGDAVSVREIAPRLLNDPMAKRMIEESRQVRSDGSTNEQIAANMVAWFSQKFPSQQSKREYRFSGTKATLDGLWHCRLKSRASGPERTGTK